MTAPAPEPEQLDLTLKAPEPDACVLEFIRILEQQTIWLTAYQLLPILGLAVTDSNKRHLRAWANASGGKILSGQSGYRHIDHATVEEVAHAANWLEHQAREMGDRARAIRRCASKRLAAPKPKPATIIP